MKIHIKSRKGMYTVISYNDKIMQLETKNSQFIVPIKDFKSLAGGKWNWGVSKEEEENLDIAEHGEIGFAGKRTRE